jgi:hypothetical protein
MRARSLLSLLTLLALFSLGASRAEAAQVRYLGPHPIAAKHGGGYCYIEAPHLHLYGPDHPNLYQQVDGEYVFAADPTPFGYDGEKHPFYGHHPIVIEGATEPVYCLIEGPHFHPYAAPSTPEYRQKNGVAFYVAPIPEVYVKSHRVKLVNAEYRPYVAFRPTIEVAPPPEWRGEVYVAGPSLEVRGPGVFMPPAPGVSVEVHGPGVFVPPPPGVSVEVRGPGVFVPPAPRLVVGVPGPPGVVVGAPGPVFVGGGNGHWEHREHGGGRWEHHERVVHEERVRHEERHEEHHEGKHGGGHR